MATAATAAAYSTGDMFIFNCSRGLCWGARVDVGVDIERGGGGVGVWAKELITSLKRARANAFCLTTN